MHEQTVTELIPLLDKNSLLPVTRHQSRIMLLKQLLLKEVNHMYTIYTLEYSSSVSFSRKLLGLVTGIRNDPGRLVKREQREHCLQHIQIRLSKIAKLHQGLSFLSYRTLWRRLVVGPWRFILTLSACKWCLFIQQRLSIIHGVQLTGVVKLNQCFAWNVKIGKYLLEIQGAILRTTGPILGLFVFSLMHVYLSKYGDENWIFANFWQKF